MSPYICHFIQCEENTSVHYLMSLFIIHNYIAGPGVGPSFCTNFFSLPSSLHEFFFLTFSLAWIFFWFFPLPPHHFSNGPSLIASRQFASQAFIFRAHETGIVITFPPRCAMSAMTLGILKISSGILCPGPALLLVNTKRSSATWRRECIPGPVAKLSLYGACSSGGK